MKNSILELIGMHARVTESVNSELIDISGVIIDETKHMLKLDTKFGEKLIPKKICTFKISSHNDTDTIAGTKLHNRSHERLEVLV
jgi:ribonuclease P protein subunit POP4